jgi:hypothetical protein
VTRVSTSALRLHTGLKGIKVRGAMDDERIDSLLTTVMDLGKQVLAMECHLAELEAAVGALKAFVAAQMFPDDPNEALNQLQTLEKTLFNSDPRTAQRKIMQEALEALHQWRRAGVPPHES